MNEYPLTMWRRSMENQIKLPQVCNLHLICISRMVICSQREQQSCPYHYCQRIADDYTETQL